MRWERTMRGLLFFALLLGSSLASSLLQDAEALLAAQRNHQPANCTATGGQCEGGKAVRCGTGQTDKRTGRIRLVAGQAGLTYGEQVRVATGQGGEAVAIRIGPPEPQ